MRQLNKITFINSADYDYFELKVDGDIAVYGINDGGKTTCARAVMFGEHGSQNALNFGQGESMDYYFHKGPNEGLLIYDYSDTRPDGIAIPYCLIISKQFIQFVPAAFDKRWVLVNEKKYTTDWSKIRTNIETLTGDVKTYAVSSMRNLEIILQGTYNGRDENMRTMTKLFSIFNGRDGKPGAVAKVIESLWKNGEMKQQDMKRIIIERAEADKRERLEREPSFEISSARTLSDGFDEGWKDFSKYISGELPQLMNRIDDTYRAFGNIKEQLRGFPSVINSVKKIKEDRIQELRKEVQEKSTTQNNVKEAKKKIEEQNRQAFQSRSEAIGGIKDKIKDIKTDYNRYDEKKWEQINKDIEDASHIADLNRKVTLLRNEIEAIEKNDEEYTKSLKEEIESEKTSYEQLQNETYKKLLLIGEEKENDKELEKLNEKKAGVNAEAEGSEAIKTELKELEKQSEKLHQEQTDINRAKDCLQKISGSESSLMDRFESKSDLSFLGKIGHEIIVRFFRIVYVFICKELFGLDDLSTEAIERKQAAVTTAQQKYNAQVKAYQKALSQEVTRLSTLYENQIIEKNKYYEKRKNKLIKDLADKEEELEIFIKNKNAEIDKIRASKGIDVETLNQKKIDCATQQERCDYIIHNMEQISRLKEIRDKFATIDELNNQLTALQDEHDNKTEEEGKSLKKLDSELIAINESLRSSNTAIGQIENDQKRYVEKIPHLSAALNMDEITFQDLIDKAPVVEMDSVEQKRLTDYIDEWAKVLETRKESIISLRTQCQALQGMLSQKDFFEFSIKPEDSLASDDDILRVAGIVNRRNNAASEESIIQFLNNWRRAWNEYLRLIYKIGERATNLSNVSDTARRLQTFINRHNEAHSILDISFEIESGSDNPIVKKALELKECLDENGIDVNSVDVTEGVDTNLFRLETLSENLRRRLVNIMSDFTKALSEYKYDAIPPEDFFTLYTCIKEENKPRLRLLSVKEIGSTGTGLTTKSILTICFVGEALRENKVSQAQRNTIHIFVDEFGRIDPWNKDAIKEMCNTFGVLLFSAEPYASNETGGVKYGYSLHYDKKTHQRGGKLIKEKRLKPVETNKETVNE